MTSRQRKIKTLKQPWMTSNTDVDLTSQWKCWYNVKIQRRSNVALRRLNNLLSTSFVVVLTLIQRCLDVAMRRWNNVVFRRRINISIATYRDVIPTSEFNVGTTLIRRLCVYWGCALERYNFSRHKKAKCIFQY